MVYLREQRGAWAEMSEYESPKVEVVEFEEEIIMYASGCNCSFWQVTNDMDAGQEGCVARSAHASENPSGIAAPDYGNW